MSRLAGVLALVVTSAPACHGEARSPAAPPASKVVFITAQGEVPVVVEVADTPVAQRRGLMFRRELAPDHGMIFVFDAETDHPFWMKNTYISLDMIYVSSALRVVGVVAGAAPMDETSLGVDKPSKYVVEVSAGFAREHGIETGSQMRLELAPPAKDG